MEGNMSSKLEEGVRCGRWRQELLKRRPSQVFSPLPPPARSAQSLRVWAALATAPSPRLKLLPDPAVDLLFRGHPWSQVALRLVGKKWHSRPLMQKKSWQTSC